MLYFDASALAKRYVREAGSAAIIRLLTRETPATSRLSYVEVASALARRDRDGAISRDERDRALSRLEEDIAFFHVVELSAPVATAARAPLLRHPLRASDAVQLASCLHLATELDAAPELVAYDLPLMTAAEREGVRVRSPQ